MVQEWQYEEKDRPQHSIDEFGRIRMQSEEPVENLVTWVYEEGSYVPVAKIQDGERYTIISDYMGRPVEAYNSYGNVVWQADYDIYGDLRNIKGIRDFIPFRQLGQYEDDETRLYYNRFRYYDPRIGNYISQDPIRLMGNNPTLYGYVGDCNIELDALGLSLALPCPNGTNPWKEGETIYSIVVPKGGMDIDMAIDIDVYTKYDPGSWGITQHIGNVDFVREQLAVTPEFKSKITHVQRFHIPEEERVQIGIVGPQEYKGKVYLGGGVQVQIFNKKALEPIGEPRLLDNGHIDTFNDKLKGCT